MTLSLRGMGSPANTWAYGTPDSNMACYLDPDCHDYANVMCYGPLYFGTGCASWRAFNPTPAQITANSTNAGANLSQASQDEATRLAQAAVAADISQHPELYGGLCPSGAVPSPDGSCSPCPDGMTPSNGVCVKSFDWSGLAMGLGLVGIAILILAVKR